MSEEPKDDWPKFETDIAPFRQPMVTSIGIVLGFLLAFLANWAAQAEDEPALATTADFIIALALLGSAGLFTAVLFRMLDNRIHVDAGERYRTTFRLYILAFVCAFVGLAIAIFI